MINFKLQISNFKFSILYALCSFFCLLAPAGCAKKDSMYRESRIVMDTFCTITVVSPSKEKAREAIEAGFAETERLEKLLNFFSPESEISAINRASGRVPVQVSRETLEVIKKAVEIAEDTGGAFDPTIGPLMRLWGFSGGSSNPSLPSEEKIKTALKLVDFKKIRIHDTASQVFLEATDMALDLGGIAKGFAADKALEAIAAKGIKAALVAMAGDIKAFGPKPDSKPWKVGIQNPRSGEKKSEEDIFASLSLQDKAISTSGDYQRFFMADGVRYHHILSPWTGYPSPGVISVSVIAHEGAVSDGLSTGIFVLGPDRGIKLLESMGLDGIIIDTNKTFFLTKNLKGNITIEKPL